MKKISTEKIKPIFINSRITQNEKTLKKSKMIEVIPADGNIYVQKDLFSGLYILRRIIGVIKCFKNDTAEYTTQFCVVIWDYEKKFTIKKTAIVFVDSFSGTIIEGYSVDTQPDALLLDVAREILKANYSKLFFVSIKKLIKLLQINKPFLER